LTSFGGLVVLQRLFAVLDFKARLARCCAHPMAGNVVSRSFFVQLILHLMLGYRELGSEPEWRWSGPHRKLLKIHTKPIGEE